MWTKWFPWRFVLQRIAKSHGFIDPMSLLAKVQQFSQPSEVMAPVELLRAGAVFHARGLINGQVIQNNLDWIWPYWVERQYDPRSPAFIPRAFSITQINLTHRNWTAVGRPGCRELPIVDPRGLVTPFFDGWSVDAWIIVPNGESLIPSKLDTANQSLQTGEELRVVTEFTGSNTRLKSTAWLDHDTSPVCRMQVEASASTEAFLVISPRPYNPEGISFITDLRKLNNADGLQINKTQELYFSRTPSRTLFSSYSKGDAFHQIQRAEKDHPADHAECSVGLATAAAMFRIPSENTTHLEVSVPLSGASNASVTNNWSSVLRDMCSLNLDHGDFKYIFDASVRSLILLTPETAYPGPYTYKRFWFRDAAFMVHALLYLGMIKRAEKIINTFPASQTLSGFFKSQDGEWDSNGQVLWLMGRFHALSGSALPPKWKSAVIKGAEWIISKRLSTENGSDHDGLLPAGFSAEHFGPNDYYYWDDFWSIAGLQSAAELLYRHEESEKAGRYQSEADSLMKSVTRSLAAAASKFGTPVMSPSPYKRPNSASVGTLVSAYPLNLLPADDPRITETVSFLLNKCAFQDHFFHDVAHSGINAYLSLHIAQVLLQAGDVRFRNLMESTAKLASPTGQWPEAVHPKTGGGCMGDGQHGWASAEWILMIRNAFVLESGGKVVLCAGIFPDFLEDGQEASFGYTPVDWGAILVRIRKDKNRLHISWDCRWQNSELKPKIEVRIPGLTPAPAIAGKSEITVTIER